MYTLKSKVAIADVHAQSDGSAWTEHADEGDCKPSALVAVGCTATKRATIVTALSVLLIFGVYAHAALDPPMGTSLVGTWTGWSGAYADVWADGNYAYVSHFGDSGVHILDISDPSNPFAVAEVRVDPPDTGASAQDVKVGNGLLFIALEGDGGTTNGVLIVDVRDPTNPVKKTLITSAVMADPHNLFYDGGFLYLVNGGDASVSIVDLRSYDPDNAPATITSALWVLSGVGNSIVHDITVHNGRLYACAWDSGLWVYDVTNVATQAPTFLGSAPGTATHSVWPTSDSKFVVTGEERGGGGIKVWEVTDNGGSITLTLRDSFVMPADRAFSVHNQVIDGHRLYNAWYQAGLQVFDIDPVTGKLALIASYDTFPGGTSGFDGNWGIYPFLGQDKIVLTDLTEGFFIVNVDGSANITLPAGLPESVHPLHETPVSILVTEGTDAVDPASVTLHLNPGQPGATNLSMTAVGGGLYESSIPPVPCASTVAFYFSAQTVTAQTAFNPLNAPAETYILDSVSFIPVLLRDNFDSDLGWTVGDFGDAAFTGIWERADPVGTGAQPEDDNPGGTGTQCYVTGASGGGLGANDIDGGKTTLFSAIFDATIAPDLYVGYARWYSNSLGGAPNSDQMDIAISNDAGTSWTTLETVTENLGAWKEVRFLISNFVTPTTNMQLRFVASDLGAGSVVEAAIDDFVLVRVLCSDLPGDANANGLLELDDYAGFAACMTGPNGNVPTGCEAYDTNADNRIDMMDYFDIHIAF